MSFEATARPDAPALLSASSTPVDQVGFAGEVVRVGPFSVRDRFENLLADVEVVLEVVEGDGRLGDATRTVRRSNLAGIVDSMGWTLGPHPGRNAMVARAAGAAPVTLTALTVDRSTVVWYELTARRAGDLLLALTNQDRYETRIAITPFDPCLCREQTGHLVERGAIRVADTPYSLDGSGSYRIAGPDAGMVMTFRWISGFGLNADFGYTSLAPTRLRGDSLLVERGNAWDDFPETWIYVRSAAP